MAFRKWRWLPDIGLRFEIGPVYFGTFVLYRNLDRLTVQVTAIRLVWRGRAVFEFELYYRD